MATVQTYVKNNSVRRYVGYIPPHGKILATNEVAVVQGILETQLILASNRDFASFLADVNAGRVTVTYNIPGAAGSAGLSKGDLDIPALVTTLDFDKAMAPGLSATPASDGNLLVFVSGAQFLVGDGVKTKDCYFSSDAGVTAKSIANIAAGDTLHWVGTVAGCQLDTNDRISVYYVV